MENTNKKFTVIVQKWFDKLNGNTYHSVRCIRHSDNAIAVGQFQYGYGEHYRQTALYAMLDAGWFKNFRRKVLADANDPNKFKKVRYNKTTIFMFEREKKYPIIWTISKGLKRDCVANGIL